VATAASSKQLVIDAIKRIAGCVKKYPIPIIGSMVTLAILGVIFYIYFHTPNLPNPGSSNGGDATAGAISQWNFKIIGSLALIVVLFGYWFVSVFTGEVTDKKVDFMIRYCYTVTLCLLASFAVFFVFPVSESPEHDFQWPEFGGPVGIVLGCTKSPRSDYIPVTGPKERKDIHLISNPDGGGSGGNGANETDTQRYISVTPKWLPKEIECGNDTLQWLLNVGGKVARYHSRSTPSDGVELISHGLAGGIDGQSHATRPDTKFTEIQGGLVVPLYFIVIALVGGLVSMMRRIPEYQARVSPNAANRLSNDEAREQLVFQLMQVLSAPLIAATAYYLVDPSTRTTSIALAFVAGFSSETVLLYIRALTTKLQPERQDRVPIIVSPSSLDFGQVAVNQPSAPSRIVLHNRGTSPVKVASIAFTGDWSYAANSAQSIGPGTTIAPATSAVLDVIFTPKTPGAQQGMLTITDDAMGSPRMIALSGEGT
jgi:hypothetical protein